MPRHAPEGPLWMWLTYAVFVGVVGIVLHDQVLQSIAIFSFAVLTLDRLFRRDDHDWHE